MRKRARLRIPHLRLTPASLIFLGLATLIAHVSFSWMGFCPADDGLVLALSRRLVLSEIPHRDFISVLPVGSALLHIPWVVLGGDHVHWLSRLFVWFQVSVIAWTWPGILHRCLKVHLKPAEYQWTAITTFAFTASTFPMMAWPVRDAVFLVTLGQLACLQKHRLPRALGYALIGMAGLCDPVFIPLAPIALGLMGGWKRPRYCLSAAAPYLLYAVWLLLSSSLGPAYQQFQALRIGFGGIEEALPHAGGLIVGLAFGSLFTFWNYGKLETGALTTRINAQRWAGTLGLYGVVLLSGLFVGSPAFEGLIAWALFGAALGVIPAMWFLERQFSWRVRAATLGSLLCLASSLGAGHGTPAIAAGIVAALLLGLAHLYTRDSPSAARDASIHPRATIAIALVSLLFFCIGRLQNPYRERPAGELNEPLAGVLPGGSLIHTNPRTYALLADLKRLADETSGRRLAVLPPIPGFWCQTVYRNPVPLDWSIESEARRPEILARLTESLDGRKGDVVILIPRFELSTLAEGESPLQPGPFAPLLDHVREHFSRSRSTDYFEVYE